MISDPAPSTEEDPVKKDITAETGQTVSKLLEDYKNYTKQLHALMCSVENKSKIARWIKKFYSYFINIFCGIALMFFITATVLFGATLLFWCFGLAVGAFKWMIGI